jgi:large subunit ribosomal protein L32
MAVPKRRQSHSRKNKRRSHDGLKPQGLTVCSHCREPKLPHRVCKNCGHYKDKPVIEGTEV